MDQPLLPNHLSTVAPTDKVAIRDTYASGTTERWATLEEFDNFMKYNLADAKYPKMKVLEGVISLDALGANELVLHTVEEDVFSIVSFQLYVSETITKSGGSSIDHISVGTDSDIEVVGHTESLLVGQEINFLTAGQLPTGTEIKLFGAKSDHAAGSGTITGGEVKVRLIYTYMDAISANAADIV